MKIASSAGALRYLVGRTITATDLRPFDAGDHRDCGVTYDPVITLDDGSQLTFSVSETEGSEYGVNIIRHARKSR